MTKKIASININLLNSTLINIVKPTIKEYYQSKAKLVMDELAGNCCAQTAVVVANIMDSSVKSLGYKIQAFHGDFVDLVNGNQVTYNHCWVYCENNTEPEKSIFIDVGRDSKPCLVMFRKTNTYDKRIPGYEHQFITKVQEIDYKASLNETEYFTGEKGLVAYANIVKQISNQKLFK